MTATDDFNYFRDNLGYFIAYDDLFSSWQTLGQKLGAQTVTAAIERFYQSLSEKSARVFYVYNQDVDRHSGVFNALDAGLSKLGENIGSRDKAIPSKHSSRFPWANARNFSAGHIPSHIAQ